MEDTHDTAALTRGEAHESLDTVLGHHTVVDVGHQISDAVDELDAALAKAKGIDDALAKARSYHDDVLAAMDRLRTACDAMENIVSTEAWPMPTYNKILFYC